MTRIRERCRPARAVALATVLLFGLVATAGIGAATAPAQSATHAVSASTGTAALGSANLTLNVTKVYHPRANHDDSVLVEYVITNPEIVDRSDVNNVTFNLDQFTGYRSNGSLVSVDGLERVSATSWNLTGEGENATIRYYNNVGELWEASGSATQVVPSNVASCSDAGIAPSLGNGGPYAGCSVDSVIVVPDTEGSTTVTTEFDYAVPGDGFVTSTVGAEGARETQDYPLVVTGEFSTYTETANGRPVTLVVPDGVDLRQPPRTVVEAIADARARLDVGNVTGTRYVVARERIVNERIKGATPSDGSHWTLVRADQPVHVAGGAWIHEYVHTTDDVETATPLLWFHEGYATYRALNLSLQTGHGSYEQYRTYLEHGTETDHEAENTQRDYHRNYYTAPLAFATLDYQMRAASGGENGTDELIESLRAADGPVEESEVFATVATLSNETVADRAERWIDETSAPEPPTLEEYRRIYGPVPNVSTEVSSVELDSERGTRTVETDGPLAVRENTTVRFELSVRNDGGATGRYRVELRSADANPFNGTTPTVYDAANGTVGGDSTTTVTLTHTFDETGSYAVDVGPVVPAAANGVDREALANPHNVTVVDENATIVRENGPHDAADSEAIATDDTSTIVFQADTAGDWAYEGRHSGYDSGPDGVVTFDGDWLSPGETQGLRWDYYGEWGYVSRLEPVDGAVPSDPDDDGEYEDLNDNGRLDQDDVVTFHNHRTNASVTDYEPAYDYDDDGDVDAEDANALFEEVSRSEL